MEKEQHQILMDAALADYMKQHDGVQPKVIMLGDDIWRERADKIAESMNRTGLGSKVEVHRLPAGCQGIVCA